MPTFGNTSGSSDVTVSLKNNIVAGKFTLSEDATVQSITAQITHSGAAKSYRCLIYRHSDNALMGETELLTSPASGAVTFNMLAVCNLVAGDYYLAAWSSSATGFALIAALDGAGVNGEDAETFTTGSPPPTYSGGDSGAYLLLIYATYTVGLTKLLGHSVNDSNGSSYGAEDVIVGGRFTMPAENGLGISMAARLTSTGAPSDLQVKLLVYRYSDLALIGETEERTFTAAATGWQSFDFIVQPNLAASTEYILCVWCEADGSNAHSILYAASGGGGSERDSATYGTAPDPMVPTVHDANDNVCIYLIYSVPSAGNFRPLPMDGGMVDLKGGMRG